MAEEFLLTTANNLEGYVIVKQCGIVFGETVFKNSFMDTVSAGLSNMIDSVRFKATEMSGQVDLIEKAREFAYEKLINAAKRRGANAIIAIESDNTIGTSNIMYLSLYGTAVKVVSIAEKEEYERKEAERKAQEEKERLEREQARQALMEKRAKGTGAAIDLPEFQFLKDITEYTSMIEIWKKWMEYHLEEIYPEIHQKIVSYKEAERMYGRSDVARKKKEIEEMILEKCSG